MISQQKSTSILTIESLIMRKNEIKQQNKHNKLQKAAP